MLIPIAPGGVIVTLWLACFCGQPPLAPTSPPQVEILRPIGSGTPVAGDQAVARDQKAYRGIVSVTVLREKTVDVSRRCGTYPDRATGCLLDKQGRVLTNYHVIIDAKQITVQLFDGTRVEAKLIGSDPNTDLALLQIQCDAHKLYPLTLDNSGRPQVGQSVRIGADASVLDPAQTAGTIKDLNRSVSFAVNDSIIRSLIQVSVPGNPGTIGAPLLNGRGEMIGIMTENGRPTDQISAFGFAIPASTVNRTVADLVRFGHVFRAHFPFAGAAEAVQGVLITRIHPDGLASRAGFKALEHVSSNSPNFYIPERVFSDPDIVVALDGVRVRSPYALLSLIEDHRPGDRVVFTVLRDGKENDIPLKLE